MRVCWCELPDCSINYGRPEWWGVWACERRCYSLCWTSLTHLNVGVKFINNSSWLCTSLSFGLSRRERSWNPDPRVLLSQQRRPCWAFRNNHEHFWTTLDFRSDSWRQRRRRKCSSCRRGMFVVCSEVGSLSGNLGTSEWMGSCWWEGGRGCFARKAGREQMEGRRFSFSSAATGSWMCRLPTLVKSGRNHNEERGDNVPKKEFSKLKKKWEECLSYKIQTCLLFHEQGTLLILLWLMSHIGTQTHTH